MNTFDWRRVRCSQRAVRSEIDVESINRCLVRITKGILTETHPEIDLHFLDFEVTQIDQFKLEAILTSGVADAFTRWSVGDGVYDSWRAIASERSDLGMMVHLFYHSASWSVRWRPGFGRMSVFGIDGDWSQEAPGSRRYESNLSDRIRNVLRRAWKVFKLRFFDRLLGRLPENWQ